jgi:nucleoside-diphosphate-sugar epimerase
MSLRVLILGVNGFIGSHLAEQILAKKDWEIYGMDIASDKLGDALNHPRMHFKKGDITVDTDWVAAQVEKCDVVLPLVAIANPAVYVQDPLRVFEIDFEANLVVVRLCVKHEKRVIFPSTSEVYGMSPEAAFDEETTFLVLGPVNKPRWIYSCSKQMMDRVIHAYGMKGQLQYTLFRPFNWMGPRLDNILEPKSSRAFSQFLGNILQGNNLSLVDGGKQRRSFTYIDDAIDALLRIIENRDGCADGRIFNIGNPSNDVSICELAELLIAEVKNYPEYAERAAQVQLIDVPGAEHFGAGYQDVGARVPSIKRAEQYLGWKPVVDLKTATKKTLDYYLVK